MSQAFIFALFLGSLAVLGMLIAVMALLHVRRLNRALSFPFDLYRARRSAKAIRENLQVASILYLVAFAALFILPLFQ